MTQPERAETTPTRFVHVGEVRFAYRRFGNPAGIGPGKGEGTQDLNQTILEAASGPSSRNGLLRLFFEPTETSQAAGAAFWERLQAREGERDPFLVGPGVQAQRTALTRLRSGRGRRLPPAARTAAPGAGGGREPRPHHPDRERDPPGAAFAQRSAHPYPDSGHGFLFQYHTLFGQHATLFLES